MPTARIEPKTFYSSAPQIVEGLNAVEKAIESSGLEKDLLELIKIRSSQLNGCAYCIAYHLKTAHKLNIDQHKLDLLAAWKEATNFSDRERAALLYTEALTKLATTQEISDEVFGIVEKNFTQNEIIFLTAAISNINNWNRISVAFRYTPML